MSCAAFNQRPTERDFQQHFWSVHSLEGDGRFGSPENPAVVRLPTPEGWDAELSIALAAMCEMGDLAVRVQQGGAAADHIDPDNDAISSGRVTLWARFYTRADLPGWCSDFTGQTCNLHESRACHPWETAAAPTSGSDSNNTGTAAASNSVVSTSNCMELRRRLPSLYSAARGAHIATFVSDAAVDMVQFALFDAQHPDNCAVSPWLHSPASAGALPALSFARNHSVPDSLLFNGRNMYNRCVPVLHRYHDALRIAENTFHMHWQWHALLSCQFRDCDRRSLPSSKDFFVASLPAQQGGMLVSPKHTDSDITVNLNATASVSKPHQ